MHDEQIKIWNENYPGKAFKDDIEKRSLFILLDKREVVAAFALLDLKAEERAAAWKLKTGKSLYLYRFGVNINYLKKGIGSFMLEKAKESAAKLGAENLRLFVVDRNEPAINFYSKNGFSQIEGLYKDFVNGNVLYEYGYEIKL